MIFVPTNYVVVVVGYPRRRGARLAHRRGAAVLSHFSLIHLTAAAAWLQGRAASSSVQRYSYWQVWISWRLHRTVEIGFFQTWPRSGFPISSSLYYIWAAVSSQQIAVRLCSAGYVCLFGHGFDYWPSNTFFDLHSIWARKIGCISMSRRQPKAEKKESIEYIRCLDIHLLYACHYKPRPVHFSLHFWRPNPCFQRGFFRKFCPYVWIVFKSGLWWCTYDI